jgi:hypothetical protein
VRRASRSKREEECEDEEVGEGGGGGGWRRHGWRAGSTRWGRRSEAGAEVTWRA